jgi:hypothetical protein
MSEPTIEIRLTKTTFDQRKKDFLAIWKAESPNEEEILADYIIRPDVIDTAEGIQYKDGEITFFSSLHLSGDHIGYVNISVPLDSDLLSDILESQVKKYNKIKTIIEATK